MTVGMFAVGLGVALMLVQLSMFFSVSRNTALSGSMRATMLGMAFLTPVFAYLAFFTFWPELGATSLSG